MDKESERTEVETDCICDPLAQTGGGHAYDCPEFEPECTCYEMIGCHQSMCPYGVMLRQRELRRSREGGAR